MRPISNTVKFAGIAVLAVGVLGGGYIAYDILSKPKPVGSDSVIAVEAPAVRKAPTKKVVIKAPVRAFQGDTKANLKLPPLVQADANKEVIAASQVKSDLRPQTVSTVVDKETGDVQTFVKTDPYPWLAVETRGDIRLSYGYKYRAGVPLMAGQSAIITGGSLNTVGRLQLTYDALRIKAFTVGIVATVDTDRDAFAGVGLSYKW